MVSRRIDHLPITMSYTDQQLYLVKLHNMLIKQLIVPVHSIGADSSDSLIGSHRSSASILKNLGIS